MTSSSKNQQKIDGSSHLEEHPSPQDIADEAKMFPKSQEDWHLGNVKQFQCRSLLHS